MIKKKLTELLRHENLSGSSSWVQRLWQCRRGAECNHRIWGWSWSLQPTVLLIESFKKIKKFKRFRGERKLGNFRSWGESRNYVTLNKVKPRFCTVHQQLSLLRSFPLNRATSWPYQTIQQLKSPPWHHQRTHPNLSPSVSSAYLRYQYIKTSTRNSSLPGFYLKFLRRTVFLKSEARWFATRLITKNNLQERERRKTSGGGWRAEMFCEGKKRKIAIHLIPARPISVSMAKFTRVQKCY